MNIPDAPALAVEPRYGRVMPWILIAGGLLVVILGLLIHGELWDASTTTVRELGQSGEAKPVRVTTTEKVPSDGLLGLIGGIAATLVLAGAFYARVSKVTLPGGSGIELGAATQDAGALAEAVTEEVQKELAEKAAAGAGEADAAEIAAKVASATAAAQFEALQLRAAASHPVLTPPAARIGAADLSRAQKGMPLSDDLLQQLAERAVKDVFEE